MKIASLRAREIFDSRGEPTVECELRLDSGLSVCSSVPSGASKGKFEAVELRDGGKRLLGKGVQKAIEQIEFKIGPALIGKELDVIALDQIIIGLDGTPNKKNLGSNSTLAVSMALYRAYAAQEQVELFEVIAWICGQEMITLPVPFFNLINGGAHAHNNLQIQEFMIVPLGAQNYRESMEASLEFFYELKALLKKDNKGIAVGDEGGFASQFEDEMEAFHYLMEALLLFSKKNTQTFAFALDVAASQWYNPKTKLYDWHGQAVTSEDLIDYYEQLVKVFPIYSIEDGLAEDDWDGWQELTKRLGKKMQLVGDDIFVTSVARIAQGIEQTVANAVLIKPNQVGTITETLQAIQFCKQNNLGTMISHRSGETVDTFIADLAVGSCAGQIKAGGCSRSERIEKYNRLLRIEDALLQLILDS